MKDIAEIAGPVPDGFFRYYAQIALDDSWEVACAFIWDETRQGEDYWHAFSREEHPNPDEARAILRYWIEQKG